MASPMAGAGSDVKEAPRPSKSALTELMELNGITDSVVAKNPNSVKSLHAFQSPILTLEAVSRFPAVEEITFIQAPAISRIEGLDPLRALHSMWLNECRVTSLAGLPHMPAMRRLVLDGNRLTSLAGIERLPNLTQLWVNDNRLDSLTGLTASTSLTQLSLARNRIDRIGTNLDACVELAELNLADNRVGEFKEVVNLSRLPALANVAFNDPHWGPNPVCNLCNYQTYLLHSLHQLTCLDTLIVAEEAKHVAEATFMKKKMYYNMRIKTLNRNTTNVIKRAKATMKAQVGIVRTGLTVLRRHCKDMQRELSMLEATPANTAMAEQIKSVQGMIEATMNSKTRKIDEIADRFHDLKLRLLAVSEQNVSRMIVELSTGGNIRLEDGKPGDVWYSSCVDLVHSRFYGRDFAALGITGVKVHRVTRIHNRFLRNRFDKRVSHLLATNPALAAHIAARGSEDGKGGARPGRRALEYLFYALPWPWSSGGATVVHAGSEVRRIAEEGFTGDHKSATAPLPPLPTDYYAAALKPNFSAKSKARFAARSAEPEAPPLPIPRTSRGIPLSNSVSIADMPRVCEGLARVLEASATWRRAPQATPRRAGADSPEAAAIATIADSVGSTAWLQAAGVDLGDTHTRSSLSLVRSGVYTSAHRKPQGAAKHLEAPLSHTDITEGLIFISKVFLGNCKSFDSEEEGKKSEEDAGAGLQYHSVVLPRGDDPKQRQWVVLDEALVLPEYAVEVEYEWGAPAEAPSLPARVRDKEGVTSGTMAAELAALGELSAGLGVAASPRSDGALSPSAIRLTPAEEADLRPLVRPLATFSNECRSMIAANAGTMDSKVAAALDGVYRSMPELAHRSQLDTMSPDALASVTGGADPASVAVLNLHGNAFERVDNLAPYVNLKTLVLSFNSLSRVEGLLGLTALTHLDLSDNKIAVLEPGCLTGIHHLATLNLAGNHLAALESLTVLQACVPGLVSLNLVGNPVASAKSYTSTVLAKLPALKELDGHPVGALERQRAANTVTAITTTMLKAAGLDDTGCRVFPHATGDVSGAGAGADATTKWHDVHSIDLSSRGLRRLSNLDSAVNLRRANFRDNEIARIEGLDRLTLLEELSLEDNRLMTLDGLSSLKFLKKLDVGKNQLTSLLPLEPLASLCQLSVEDNAITSLAGLTSLRSLMELYIGNNKVENIKEVRQLKEMPKLIILDLSGNPLCAAPNYRLYTVYHLRRLKVLDGVGVDSDEQQAAKERYSGRLTVELLEEKIGHSYFEAIRELDLASCRIREIEALNPKTFRCLSSLNLDHNNLTGSGIVGLRELPHLSVLRLNHNKVTSLLPTFSEDPTLLSGAPRYLAQLEVLQLGFNKISDMSSLCLDRLPALKVLYLHGNDIQRVSGLGSCSGLRELVLDKNQVKYLDAASFVGAGELRELRMQENGLRSLSHLSPLTSLQVLAIGYNRISEAGELDKLATLPYLSELWMNSNPVARKQLYRPALVRKLPELRVIDGREVGVDERDRSEAMYSGGDSRSQPVYVQEAARGVAGRVPLQVTSVNFDSLAGAASAGLSVDGVGTSSSQAAGPSGAAFSTVPITTFGMQDGVLSAVGGDPLRPIRRTSGLTPTSRARVVGRRAGGGGARVADVPGFGARGSRSSLPTRPTASPRFGRR